MQTDSAPELRRERGLSSRSSIYTYWLERGHHLHAALAVFLFLSVRVFV